MITIITFNILAPNFADPKYYPPKCEMFLDPVKRRIATTNFINSIKSKCDIFAFQEVTYDTEIETNEAQYIRKGEFRYIENLLSDEFTGMFFSHDKEYWGSFFSERDEYSYIKNGNAIFFRRSIFKCHIWHDVPLQTGNHSVRCDLIHISTGSKVRVLNLHLDSQSHEMRIIELSSVLNNMSETLSNNTIDLIVGDFNTNSVNNIIRSAGFNNSIQDVGICKPTFAFDNNEPIDHILYRGDITPIPENTIILDGGFWDDMKDTTLDNNYSRIETYFNLSGSDHLPVMATFSLNSI